MTSRLRNLLLATSALLPLGAVLAVAGPDGANVVGGAATVHGQGSANVTINQSSERAVINWRQFDIGPGETTRFNQPNSSSVALNRVTGGLGPSQLMGTLSANGRVFVINRDGILIGPNARIDTAGFLATTNDIRNDDFMAGRYNFNIPGRPDASVVNHGTITAHSAGFAALVAPGVRNTGTITATLGTVGLASGNSFTLDFYGDRLITLAVGDSIGTTVRDVQTGQPLNSLVENVGRIQANGGRVELTAAEARRVVDSVINNRGVIEANTVGTRGGTIVLGAATTRTAGAPRQTVRVSGTLSAAAPKGTKGAKIRNQGGEGGRVIVTGENIEVAGARIDVSGPARGGTVLIGGDWAGGNPNTSVVSHERARLENQAIPNAATVTVDSATVIDASASESGDAGKVIVWADGATSFRGSIMATGGPEGGNGGFVEVSGHQFLDYRGTVDTRAPMGATGTLLLDPWNVTIMLTASTNGSFVNGVWTPTGTSVLSPIDLQNQLLTSNVVVTTNGSGTDPGDITVASDVTWANNNSLTFSAHRNVQFNDNVTVSNTGGGNFIVRADSQGTGTGNILFQQFTMGSRVDWTQSTGNVSFYYNPAGGYTAPTDFTPTGQGGGRGVLTNVGVQNQFTPYMLVNNVNDLTALGQNSFTRTQSYALGADINATGFNGFGQSHFFGTLDGNGGVGPNRTISNLTLTSGGTQDAIGLFPFIGTGGVVRNLNLTNVNITPGNNTQMLGAVAGVSDGTVSNVTVAGTISNPNNFGGIIAGGVVGMNTSNTTVTQSTSSVTVNVGTAASLSQLNTGGGLVGSNQGTITNSSASGDVSGGANTFVGGLAGQNGQMGQNPAIGTITNSSASGNVTISGLMSFAGGLVGSNAPGSTITNGRAFGNVTSTANGAAQNDVTSVGGLVGQNAGTITSPTTPAETNVCSGNQSCATGTVTVGAHGQGGGLVGFNMGTINNSFALGAVTTAVDGAGDNANTHLGGLAGASQGTITNSFASGNVGDPNNPRAFVMAGGLVSDNAGTITNSFARGNVVVGDNSQAGGLVASNSPFDCQNCPGPFGTGQNNDAAIANSQASGNVTGGSASVVGGFAGGGSSGTFNNVSAIGAVTGADNSIVGGLVAALDFGGVITQSSATGAVASTGPFSFVGGLAGLNVGAITSSSSSGTVSATDFSAVGGLVGVNLGSITQSTTPASATVTAPGIGNVVGGLVGVNAGTIQQNSNAAGAVTGGMLSSVGGLVGANIVIAGPNVPPGNPIPGSSFPAGTITDSIATGDVSGGPVSFVGGQVGSNGGVLTGLTSANNVSGGDGSIVGGLVGLNSGPLFLPPLPGAVEGCTLPTCGALQDAQASTGPGTIMHSSSTGTVTGGAGSFVGGLVGWNLFGGISESNASGAVTGGPGSVAGGLVAMNFGSIGASFSGGPVTVGDGGMAGGLVGLNLGVGGSANAAGLQAVPGTTAQVLEIGAIRQSYSTSPVTGGAGSTTAGLVAVNGGLLDQTYAIGLVSGGPGSTTGGLVAINSGAFTIPPEFGGNQLPTLGGTVTSSYWDPTTTGQQTSAAGSIFPPDPLPPGFDPNVWTVQTGTYPCIGGQDCKPRLPPITPDPPPPNNPPNQNPLDNLLPPPSTLVVASLTQTTDTNPTTPGEVVNTTQTTQTTQTQTRNQPRTGNQTTGNNNGPLRPDGRPSNIPPLNETRFINDQVVVQIGAGVSADVLARVVRRLGLSVMTSQTLGLLGTQVIQFRIGSGRSVRDVIIELEKQRIIDEATPNYEFTLAQDTTSSVPQGDPAQYIIGKLKLAEAHRIATGENVLVAVIDSEIDGKHPDLEGRIADRFDAVGPADKPHPHGTGMAGAIASHKKLMGTAPGARILAIRAFGSGSGGAQGTTVQIVKGLDWAISQGAKVVNMSFAGPKDPTLAKAFKVAHDKGVVLIAAAGNAGPKSPPLFPGADGNVIAVTATDVDDNVYTNANRGKYVAVAAPGVDILVPAPDGGYEFTTGTSVAAAHVSGVAALLMQRDPKLTPAAIRQILISTAKQLGKTQGGRNDDTGSGLIDPYQALQSLGAKSAGVTAPAAVAGR